MDIILEKSLLYDFYGELLTANQRRIYEKSIFEDLSLSEIAEQEGTTRQAVHDMIKRSEAALHEYEEKLGLVKRFADTKDNIAKIKSLCREDNGMSESEKLKKISEIADMISNEA